MDASALARARVAAGNVAKCHFLSLAAPSPFDPPASCNLEPNTKASKTGAPARSTARGRR
eukprot:CAMPEP_0195097328 /NCGR_PEP_ID=MMETSP0448-20130528/52342_1 /TAXON_ID=66468 /ORGANISM="Heterocapsa triquestra, Strain CCMP 448" /LENGTH=59 /DNA_ID=CAMNT_0040131837 /DNA_START=11 /DNA_END=187 /DNA_ORIENTATION=+